jgi:hypothetical protein
MGTQIAGANAKLEEFIFIAVDDLTEAIHKTAILIPPGEKATGRISIPVGLGEILHIR